MQTLSCYFFPLILEGLRTSSSLFKTITTFTKQIAHFVIHSDWNQIKINQITLPEALQCWEQSPSEHNHHEFDLMFDNVRPIRHHRRPSSASVFDKDHDRSRDLLSDSPVDQLIFKPPNMRPTTVLDSTLLPSGSNKQHTHVTLIEEKLLTSRSKRKRKRKQVS